MKTLPIEKVWTGDGFSANPVTLKQVSRSETAAVYERREDKGKRCGGFEVFTIKLRLKGQALPGGGAEEEDREVYPSANAFGKSAWQVVDKAEALSIMAKLTAENAPGAVEEDADLTIPVAEFTVGELADSNGITYSEAQAFVKAGVSAKTIQFLRKERRNPKGKPSSIYAKV